LLAIKRKKRAIIEVQNYIGTFKIEVITFQYL